MLTMLTILILAHQVTTLILIHIHQKLSHIEKYVGVSNNDFKTLFIIVNYNYWHKWKANYILKTEVLPYLLIFAFVAT